MSGHMLIPLLLLNTIPLFPFQSHFPLFNPTIIISIPLFAHQSHFFGRIFIIPLLLFSYILGKILLKVALTLQITWISVVLRLGLESVVIRWSGSSYAHDSIVAVKYGSNSHLFQTRVWGQGGVAHTPHANLSLCLAFTFTFVNEVD